VSVDLNIPGDPAAIRAVADWLSPRISDADSDVYIDSVDVSLVSQAQWVGQSGDAFRDALDRVRGEQMKISPYLTTAADVFLAYANRLERGQDDFDHYLEQAIAGGLVGVRRTKTILTPTTSLPYCPTVDAPAEDVTAWNDYVRRVELYNDISTRVGTWWGELEAWIVEHMVPLVARIEEFAPLSGLFDDITVGNEVIVSTALETADYRVNRDFTEWSKVYDQMQADAELYTRGLRSGNPALKAASEAANPRAIREGLEQLGETIKGLRRATRIIPGVGIAIDVALGVVDIANGDSASSVGVGILGGMAGGAAVGGTIAAVGGPPGWVIGGVVVGGVVVGEGARWAWEAWVPLHVRESIDDFFVGDPPVLVNEATGTWAVGTR
jgi:hypothetical protein